MGCLRGDDTGSIESLHPKRNNKKHEKQMECDVNNNPPVKIYSTKDDTDLKNNMLWIIKKKILDSSQKRR